MNIHVYEPQESFCGPRYGCEERDMACTDRNRKPGTHGKTFFCTTRLPPVTNFLARTGAANKFTLQRLSFFSGATATAFTSSCHKYLLSNSWVFGRHKFLLKRIPKPITISPFRQIRRNGIILSTRSRRHNPIF